MEYREFHPSPALAGMVERLWILKDPGASGPGPVERVLPDGRIELILHFGDRFQRIGARPSNGSGRAAGSAEPQPRAFLVGQMTGPLSIQATGRIDVLGVRFRPGGLAPFVRMPIDELTGRTPAVEDLWGSASRGLIERAGSCGSDAGRIAQVEEQLATWLARWGGRDAVVDSMAAAILSASGRLRVGRLAGTSGLSGRQLERRFRARVGVGPKTLCRLARFQSVMAAMSASPAHDWTSLALDSGYYDQSHFIREFKDFAGVSPTAWSAQRHPLSDLFTG